MIMIQVKNKQEMEEMRKQIEHEEITFGKGIFYLILAVIIITASMLFGGL